MESIIIEEIIQKVGPVRWVDRIDGIQWEGWFLYEADPLPPKDQLADVISDICADNIVRVNNGRVIHSPNCEQSQHLIDEDIVRWAIPKIRRQKFRVAVYPNIINVPVREPFLGGRPMSIAVDPQINYAIFPDHPHLNMSNPASLCYTDESLPSDPVERLYQAFKYITIWLFRYQVWLATREFIKHGKWIGPQAEHLKPEFYAYKLNPNGLCRCGKNKLYSQCCMELDTLLARENLGEPSDRYPTYNQWLFNVAFSEMKVLELLRKAFN